MTLKHNDIIDDLPLYWGGDLDADRIAEIDEHLKNCSGCRNEYEAISTTLASVEELGEVDSSTRERARRDLDLFYPQRVAPLVDGASKRGWWVPLLSRAALVLIAFGAGMYVERFAFRDQSVVDQQDRGTGTETVIVASETTLDRAYEDSSRGQSGLVRGLLALKSLRGS